MEIPLMNPEKENEQVREGSQEGSEKSDQQALDSNNQTSINAEREDELIMEKDSVDSGIASPEGGEKDYLQALVSDNQAKNTEYPAIYIQDIYLLTEQGISPMDIDKLKKIGINTIKGLQMTPSNKLLSLKSFDDKKIKALQDATEKLLDNSTTFVTALKVCDLRKIIFKIPTGSKNIDRLLNGGIESMGITEVFGESRTGKTQLAHTLCVTAQITNEDIDYMGGKVMFIDTENTFRPDRIKQIAKRFQMKAEDILENILYARAYTNDHLFQLIKNAAKKFHEEVGVFKLLIVDSIMALFRTDFFGRGELVNRQQKLGQILAYLQKISEEFNIAIYVTNQITSTPSATTLLNLDTFKPTGGNIMAHSTTTRIAIKKALSNVRIATLYDSPELEEKEVLFLITNGGINDPSEMTNNN